MGLSILLCNQDWFAKELSERGHRVVTAGPPGRGFMVEYRSPGAPVEWLFDQLPSGFIPDRLVYYDDSGPAWLSGIGDLPLPTLYYSVDAHHHHQWHKWFATLFDQTVVAQRDYLVEFTVLTPTVRWLPLWSPDVLTPQRERPIDVSFRGTFDRRLNPARVEFFARLREFVPVDAGQGDFRTVYPKSKIVINQAVKNDVNFRVFEALASGAMLLTPDLDNGMLDLFIPGEDLVTYPVNDAEAAAEKIRYYLIHDDERREIAERGYRKLMTYHTAEKRAAELEAMLIGLKRTERLNHELGAAMTFLYASDLSRRNGDHYGERYLRIAGEHLVRSLERGETLTATQEETALLVKSYYTQRGLVFEARELMERLHNAAPKNIIYSTLLLDALRKTGRM